jgi:hypothetical protein
MYKSFKSFKEDHDIIDFGKKYDLLCHAILESGMTFDEFWINQGLPLFINGGARNEQELQEGWMDSVRGGVAGLGTLGKQAIRGGANALSGAAQAGYGALQTGVGAGKGLLGGGFDTMQNGMSNMGNGVLQAGSGIGQVATAPISAGIRGYEAGKQNGMGMNTGNQLQQWMGTRQAPNGAPMGDPQQQPQQQQPPQPQPQPQPPQQQPLSQNQQQRVSAAIDEIKQSFNDSISGLVEKFKQANNKTGSQVAQGFLDKVNAYAGQLKVKRRPEQAQTQAQ